VLDFAKHQKGYPVSLKEIPDDEDLISSTVLSQLVAVISRMYIGNERDEMVEYLAGKKIAVPLPDKLPNVVLTLQPYKKRSFSTLKSSSFFFYLFIIFLVGFFASVVYFDLKKNKKQVASFVSNDDTPIILPPDTAILVQNSNKRDSGKFIKSTLTHIESRQMKAATKPLVTLGDREKKQVAVSYTLPDSLNKNSAGKTAYKIINKAYFHNAPDERTKRNAFVVHWNNSYTTINPLYEKWFCLCSISQPFESNFKRVAKEKGPEANRAIIDSGSRKLFVVSSNHNGRWDVCNS
jgi:hypothetical protein